VLTCPSCGTQCPPGSKFCTECATRLAATCPSCGTVNGPAAKFCSECATSLSVAARPAVAAISGPQTPAGAPPGAVAASPPALARPVAERRLVSILFADLVGFTPFAEGRDAEEVRETLTRYFDLSREVIGRYGGTVEKFIGDAVMAVWGAPTAREDDAELAVRAALELVDSVRTLGEGISARAAVLTGEAAVTIGATDQGMVAGDLVNTCSRLQSVAPAGTVLVGEATQRAASMAIAFEEAGEHVLKGKAAPVAAWRAVRLVAEVGGRNRAEGLEAPFVGRDDELRLLKDLFHATGRERRTRLVSVIGPAGIGKSRLAWEFLKYVDGLVETTLWHDGRSPAYGQGLSFWALGEMVRARAGLVEGADEETTRARIAATLEEHVPDPEERRWIGPALLALLGIESGISTEQLFAAWRTFFERLSASAPVVMVFEDLHFADPGLLDFIDHLLDWSRTMPITVVTLSRPELLDKRPDWGAGKRNFVSLFLEPLTEPAMRELLRGLVPGLPDGAVQTIVGRADGIPLYAVETVRMLVADGRLSLADGVYTPTGDLTRLAVPETLTALIASRLDGLEPADRALVQDAAVMGQSFSLAGLAAVSGQDEKGLEARLHGLVRRELLTLETDPRSPERGQYVFVQALIREVAYNTLARRERRARHLAAARYFEGLGSDELAGALARHYLAAFQNATEGPEADALAGQARIALSAAAARATSLGAHEQALTFLDEALAVAGNDEERAELLGRAGEAAASAGRFDDAEQRLTAAIELRRRIGERSAIAAAAAALGRALQDGGRNDPAMALLEAASAEFADLRGEQTVVALDAQLARLYMRVDRFDESLAIADRVLAAAEHADNVPVIADVLVTRGSSLAFMGQRRQGIGLVALGGELAEGHGLTYIALRARNNHSGMLADIDPPAALEAATQLLQLARRSGMRSSLVMATAAIADIRIAMGDWDTAQAEVAAALAELPDISASDLRRLDIQLRAGRGAAVADRIDEYERLLTEHSSDARTRSAALDLRALVALAEGQLEEARDVSRRSHEMVPWSWAVALSSRACAWLRDVEGVRRHVAEYEELGVHGAVVDAEGAAMRAGLAALEARREEAISLYRDALRRCRDLGLAWNAALTVIDMATLLGPGESEVVRAAGPARETLTRIGAAPFLARLDAAMAPDVAAAPAADGAVGSRP
jgi:class 3 adenylate cyclase/tetratricopeptide (TPR) repeat protein